MQHIYIDESGSMTCKYADTWPYFVISLITVSNKEKAKKAMKRFVAKNIERLRKMDVNGKMFSGDCFLELKGSCMDKEMKESFVEYMCRNDLVNVYYVVINNKEIKYGLYANTARAFNYVLAEAIECFIKKGLISEESCWLHIDERNQKTGTLNFLEEYLNTRFVLEKELLEEVKVSYYDSANNSLIQVADVFSNVCYSNCLNKLYKDMLSDKYSEGYVRALYKFPERNLYAREC